MKNLIIGLILGALFAMVNNWTFEDEVLQETMYCEMNSKGMWYDSPERYTQICQPEHGGQSGSVGMGDQEKSHAPKTVTFVF